MKEVKKKRFFYLLIFYHKFIISRIGTFVYMFKYLHPLCFWTAIEWWARFWTFATFSFCLCFTCKFVYCWYCQKDFIYIYNLFFVVFFSLFIHFAYQNEYLKYKNRKMIKIFLNFCFCLTLKWLHSFSLARLMGSHHQHYIIYNFICTSKILVY